jgi:hypothetical protein
MEGCYLNTTTQYCVTCPLNCSTCYSSSYCTTCSKGYLASRSLVSPSIMHWSDYFDGIYLQPVFCIKCYFPCQTCFFLPTFCTSCIVNYNLYNNYCVSSFNFMITLTLNPSSNQAFVDSYYEFLSAFANAAGVSISQTSVISITYSSVKV